MSAHSENRNTSGLDQNSVPLIRAVEEFISSEPAYFRIPAHRFSRGIDENLRSLAGEQVFCADLTEAEGLDDLHAACGPIAEAEALAAGLWGSEECHFLVNGSTCGNEAMLLTCVRPGEKVLLARNVHKSVLMGLVLSGAVPVWMPPEPLPDKALDGPISPDTVQKCLQEEPDCRAVMLVSPTYYGICSPLKEIASLCHARSIPLLVDEAHGSHLRFLMNAPGDAVSSGADLVVQSLHKTGGSMTQSSLLHVQGRLIDRARLYESLSLVMSTSPSYVLMASLDGARHQLALRGTELMLEAYRLAERCRRELKRIPGIAVLEYAAADPLRVVFSAVSCGISGSQLQDLLFREGRISLELSDPVYAVAVITWGNTDEDVDRLIDSVRRVAANTEKYAGKSVKKAYGIGGIVFCFNPKVICSPREAWHKEKVVCPLEKCCGKIAAESVIPYPPGIPVLYPGEYITGEILDCLFSLRSSNTPLHGPADSTLKTIRVLKEE